MNSDSPIRRRELLVSGGIAAAVLTAGCAGGGEETNGDGESDETTDGSDANGDETEEQGTPTASEEEESSEETDTVEGPLTAEWATPYPDEVRGDGIPPFGDMVVGGKRAYITSQEGASVVAFDLADGEILWRWEEYVQRPAPALAYHEAVGPVVVLRSQGNNGDVYALDAESGTVEWEYQREAVGSRVAAATDQYVVAGSGTGVTVLDPADGSVVTEFGGLEGVDFGTPTQIDVDQSALFGLDTFGNTITAHDLETGEQRWQVSEFEVERTGELSVVVVDGTPVGTDSSSVFGIDPQTEEVTFRLDVSAFDQELVGSDSRVFFVNETNPSEAVRAIDVAQGTIGWEQTGVRASPITPALVGDRLLVASQASVTLLDASAGDIIQEAFDPTSGLDTESAFQGVVFLAARDDTAVVAGRAAMYGLSIGN